MMGISNLKWSCVLACLSLTAMALGIWLPSCLPKGHDHLAEDTGLPPSTDLWVDLYLVAPEEWPQGIDAVEDYRLSVINLHDQHGPLLHTEVRGPHSMFRNHDRHVTGLPSGVPMQVTVAGFSADGTILALGRSGRFEVSEAEDTRVSLSVYPYPSNLRPLSSLHNVLFPTLTPLLDGRVLLAGGFATVAEEGDRFHISGASSEAALFDPTTATWKAVDSSMNLGRGAHAAVMLPEVNQVLLVGGADGLYYEKDPTCFPWYAEQSGGELGRSYEIFDVTQERFLSWDLDWPDAGVVVNRVSLT